MAYGLQAVEHVIHSYDIYVLHVDSWHIFVYVKALVIFSLINPLVA